MCFADRGGLVRKRHTAPSQNAKCPTAYSRISGEVFAGQQRRVVEIQKLLRVLEAICLHWRARLYFSDRCYRFEQYNLRAGRLSLSAGFHFWLAAEQHGPPYEELINQTHSGTRTGYGCVRLAAGNEKAVVNYGHPRAKLFGGTSYIKWYKTSGSNDAVDRKHRVRCGLLHQDFGHTETESHERQHGALAAGVRPVPEGGRLYAETPLAGCAAFLPLEYDTPAEWLYFERSGGYFHGFHFQRLFRRAGVFHDLDAGGAVGCGFHIGRFRRVRGFSTTWRTT